MSDAVAASPTPGHELLLGLAGWVDDDLLAIGRELVAVGEEAGALELLVASLAADRTVLPHPVRAGLAHAVEQRIGADLARLLPPGAPQPGRTAHLFAADAGDPEVAARIAEVVAGLSAVARSGARTSVTWRLTPSGAAPGPLPHPVVLLVLDDPAPAEVLAYQVGAALARAGIAASVEAFAHAAALPPYQRAALATVGAPVSGDVPFHATPTSATVTGPYERDTRSAPEDAPWSGPYAALPDVDRARHRGSGRSAGDADADGASAGGAGSGDGPAADPTVPAPGTAAAGLDGADRRAHRASSVEDTWSVPAASAEDARPPVAAPVDATGRSADGSASASSAHEDGATPSAGDLGTASPLQSAGSVTGADSATAASRADSTASSAERAGPAVTTGSAVPAGGTGTGSAAETTGPGAHDGPIAAASTAGAGPGAHGDRTGAASAVTTTGPGAPFGSGPASRADDTGAGAPVERAGTAAPETTGAAASAVGAEAVALVETTRAGSPPSGAGTARAHDAGTVSPVETTGPTPAVDRTGAASAEATGAVRAGGPDGAPRAETTAHEQDAGSGRPSENTRSVPPVDGADAARSGRDSGETSPARETGSAPAGEGGAPESATGGRAPHRSAPQAASGTPSAQAPGVGSSGVDPARFDPARNAVDRTVHGGSAVPARPTTGAGTDVERSGPPVTGGTAAETDRAASPDPRPGPVTGPSGVRPEPAPDPDAGTNGHPSPRPAPRHIPRPGSPSPGADDRPSGSQANGHASPEAGGSEQDWARQWSNGSWSMPAEPTPEPDPDREPATSPTPTTPPLGRALPSPTRRASGPDGEALDRDPDGSAPDARPRHRLDAPGPVAPGPSHTSGYGHDALDSRLTPNEQELLRRLQQELAAREGGSADPRNGTPHASDQD